LQIDELKARLQRKGVSLQLNGGAKQFLLDNGYDAHNGVRPLRRLIQDTIEDHLALELLDEKYEKGDIIQVAAKKGALDYAIASE
jgi:ATP-dependent Clp protease ATP-binding subunit ClpC